MASYNDDPVQDHVPKFMDISESSGDNGDGNDVEVDLESHVKVKKQASKRATNKGKGNQKRPPPPPTNLGGPQFGKRKKRSEIWDHYDEIPNPTVAKCKYCQKSITCATKNRTSVMLNHTKRCKKYPGNMDIK